MGKGLFVCFLIATLGFSLLAATSADQLDLATVVAEIGLMKITSAPVSSGAPSALTNYNNAPELTTYGVTGSGDNGVIAYVTTLSNKRAGYYITVFATAMASGTSPNISYINYKITCPNGYYETANATVPPAITIIDVSNLTVISASSVPISLYVEPTSFNAAVAGSYEGKVTFTFTAK